MIQNYDLITSKFESSDINVYCDFVYIFNIKEEKVLPIPFRGEGIKIEENGRLKWERQK